MTPATGAQWIHLLDPNHPEQMAWWKVVAAWDEVHARQRASLEGPHLEHLREIAKAYPETSEHDRFGGVWWKAGRKVFMTFHTTHGDRAKDHKFAISFATSLDDQDTLCQGGAFYPTPYMRKHGWVSMPADDPDWKLVADLADGCYRRVALKRMLRTLDEDSNP